MGALEGKVAAITGASSGIGEATALALAAEGAAVSLAARRKDRLDDLVGRIESDGGRALAIETDVTDEGQANAFVNGTNEELGGLDILVNNAGVMLLGPIAGAPTDQWRRMIEVNLLGLLYCTHAALPIMGAAGSGHVVNVSSVAGRTANLGSGVYNMTKWGVVGFSEALRQEILNANVRVDHHRAGLRRHRAPEPQRAPARRRDDGEDDGRHRQGPRVRRHRPRDRLRGHPARARLHQRDADPPDDVSASAERQPRSSGIRIDGSSKVRQGPTIRGSRRRLSSSSSDFVG